MKYAKKEYSDAIKNYMEKLGISKEEAEQLWKDDHEDFESPEMKEMGRKAKQISRREKSDTPRKKSSRERKVDTEKKRILSNCKILVEGMGGIVTKVTNETDFSFDFNDYHYTLKIIRHRDPK